MQRDNKHVIGEKSFENDACQLALEEEAKKAFWMEHNHSIDSLYSPNSVNVYVPSENQQFRYKIARRW